MNTATAVALIGIGVGVLCHLLTSSYFYGRLNQRVFSNEGWLGNVSESVDNHEKRLSRVEGHLGLNRD